MGDNSDFKVIVGSLRYDEFTGDGDVVLDFEKSKNIRDRLTQEFCVRDWIYQLQIVLDELCLKKEQRSI